MTDTKANIRAKKTGSTGITEELAKKFADAGGGHLVAIVELKVDEVHEKVGSGDRKVDFVIDTIEPVLDGKLEGALVDHVRDIQRALFRNRKLSEDGPQLPMEGDSNEPTVEGVLAARKALIDEDEEGPKLWDGQFMPAEHSHEDEADCTDDCPVKSEAVSGDGDTPDAEEPWEYDQPEGTTASTTASTTATDPFAVTT